MNPNGRPPCPIVQAWRLRFGLTKSETPYNLTDRVCWQLSRCRSDEARRLILGVSE